MFNLPGRSLAGQCQTPRDAGARPIARRRQSLVCAILLAATLMAGLDSGGACAQTGALPTAQAWPDKPIQVIIIHPPGSGTDPSMRRIAVELSKVLGQTVNIENRPGAGGRIATAEAARLPADGYHFLLGDPGPLMYFPATGGKTPYDPDKDFVPVARGLVAYPLLVVSGDSTIKSVEDFKTLARVPSMAVLSIGGLSHAQALLFSEGIGRDLNVIPYSTQSASKDVVGGTVDAMLMYGSEAVGLANAGRIRVLASFGPARHAKFPDTPAITEITKLRDLPPAWSAIYAPAGTPQAIVEQMRGAFNKVLSSATIRTWAEPLAIIEPIDGPALKDFLEKQKAIAVGVVKRTGMKAE
jgi:tripartite-type tricarboxylate transporter receptor subunit TctC